ncbi:alpha/beta hydrolase [Methylorubrum extorquens]|uniref:Alpha/beta hydrolase domain protein n=2 Tax=Methylorubrum extorquens TaxID=408 RepID=C5B687_METEA|nr:alpha/beta hydrolase [Methylorubrum extorquens]ACS43969.1 Putative alpha/beta hydrolase domain protein [Methylorubrum extorquens AM1]EHP95086.1 putative alpha/beta hydrolase domain protein [Methylorubrum extorquens DSM 13060]MCP1546168.1 acetyl esterase/lipase [Methylorubrum extorquens]MCP1590835.1 acetyl esterase/lipase [Methylorubrum extorquens]
MTFGEVKPSTFHPDLRPAARWLPRGMGRPWMVKLLRALPSLPARVPAAVTRHELSMPGFSPVKLRCFVPTLDRVPLPAILWIHGGGYVFGSAKQDDGYCARLASSLGAVVVSVDYRLAPEHPFPQPLEDCFQAYLFMHREATALKIDMHRVAVAGQSAGAGLAAALVQLIRDRGAPAPVMQSLSYPMLDDRTVLHQADDRRLRLWDSRSNRLGWAAYLPVPPGASRMPDYAAAARCTRLEGLPPAWIGVGTHDLFHDECVDYARRLREAQVQVELEVVDGAFHGFDVAVPEAPVSRRFFQSQAKALDRAFAGEML